MIHPRKVSESVPPLWESVEYSSVAAFSAENKYLLTIAVDHFRLRDGSTGALIVDLAIGASMQPRWARTNPDLFYFVSGNTLASYDVAAHHIETLHQFTEYSEVSGLGESDLSNDSDHLVLCGDRKEAFVWIISAGIKAGLWQVKDPDGLKLGQDNKIILSDASGIHVLETSVILNPHDGHAAVCSFNGEGYLIVTDNRDNAIYRVRIADGERVKLLDVPWPCAVDVSACDQGFALISTYSLQNAYYPGQILKVALDGSGAEVLCETGSVMIPKPGGGMYYTPQPRATLSRDGSRFAFSSNSGKVDVPEYCETFLGIIGENYSEIITEPPTKALTEIDFSKDEGREWQWHFKVVDGKMTVKVFDVEQKAKVE